MGVGGWSQGLLRFVDEPDEQQPERTILDIRHVQYPPPRLVKPAQPARKIPPLASRVLAIFDHYRHYHPRAHKKPHPKMREWKLVADRLAEGYTVEDLRLAIDGCHQSPFHCGENERGTAYQALELIVRSSSKVTAFMEYLHQPTAVLSERTRRSLRAAESWALGISQDESHGRDESLSLLPRYRGAGQLLQG